MKEIDYIDPDVEQEVDHDEILSQWLTRNNWSFGSRSNTFAGFSEGVCILAGIDPEESQHSEQEGYLWWFIGGSAKHYGSKGQSGWINGNSRLNSEVISAMERFADLIPSGIFPPKIVIKKVIEKRMFVPWLDLGVITSEQVRLLPENALRNRVKNNAQVSDARKASGYSSADGNDAHSVIKGFVWAEFDAIRKNGFQGYLAQSSGKENASKISDEIYKRVVEQHGDDPGLPARSTVYSAVRKWLKNL